MLNKPIARDAIAREILDSLVSSSSSTVSSGQYPYGWVQTDRPHHHCWLQDQLPRWRFPHMIPRYRSLLAPNWPLLLRLLLTQNICIRSRRKADTFYGKRKPFYQRSHRSERELQFGTPRLCFRHMRRSQPKGRRFRYLYHQRLQHSMKRAAPS